MVLVVGEFDLSIGYAASFAGVLVTGLIANQGLPIPVGHRLIALILGAAIGAVNGLLVTKARVNAVVATLGVGTILTGLAFGYTAGSPIVAVAARRSPTSRWAGSSDPRTRSGSWCSCSASCGCSSTAPRSGQRIQAVGANASAPGSRASGATGSKIGRLRHRGAVRGPHRHPARVAAGQRHAERRRRLPAGLRSPRSSSARRPCATASSTSSARSSASWS